MLEIWAGNACPKEDRPNPRFQIVFEQLYHHNSTGKNWLIFPDIESFLPEL